jgi:hypothetical protein
MRGFAFLVLATAAGIGFTTPAAKAADQVGVEVGVALSVLMATMMSLLIIVRRMATMDRNGLREVFLLAPDRGSMGTNTSVAT